jgi:hypothetical protein
MSLENGGLDKELKDIKESLVYHSELLRIVLKKLDEIEELVRPKIYRP